VARYRLTIAYDGTEFSGWQKQEPPAGAPVSARKVLGEGDGGRVTLRTVQEVVERAVREVVGEPALVVGASRTDAGVHARGQVAAFTCSGGEAAPGQRDGSAEPAPGDRPPAEPARRARTGWPLPRGTDRLVLALNSRLPADVLVVAAVPAPDSFDPIGDCVAKGYSYTIHVSPHRPLFDRRYVHHVWVPLDLDAMRRAAERIVGEHDFAAFAAAGHGRQSTVRRVLECRVEGESPAGGGGAGWARRVRIQVSGTGFLWNMVRIIAGTLVEVGRGKMTPEAVGAVIESRDRRRAGPTLPAHGLCLEWVRYPTPIGGGP
jgi:tRNA pseudouridine38-40 synthase